MCRSGVQGFPPSPTDCSRSADEEEQCQTGAEGGAAACLRPGMDVTLDAALGDEQCEDQGARKHPGVPGGQVRRVAM